MQELWLDKWGADAQRATQRGIDLAMIDNLKAENRKLLELQKQHADHIKATKGVSEKKLEDLTNKLAHLTTREHNLGGAETELKRRLVESKTYRDYCDAVQVMGSKAEKTVEEMKTIDSGSSRAKQAYDKWEKSNCRPQKRLLEFTARVEKAQKTNRIEHAKHMKAQDDKERELEAIKIEQHLSVQRLSVERQVFAKEQADWREQQARDLGGTEAQVILELAVRIEIDRVTPKLQEQAMAAAYARAKEEVDSDVLEKARIEGRRLGYHSASHMALRKQ